VGRQRVLSAERGHQSPRIRPRQEPPTDNTVVYGSAPRVVATLAPQRLFASPAYVSLNSDVAYLPYRHLVEGALVQDNSFGRLDASPSIRIPFSRLSFLSINTSAAYRATYYTRHASETAGELEDGAFFRQYATLRTEVVGPVFNRIFDVKDSGFAERIKHVIEPAVSVDVTSPIQDFRKTPALLDTSDFIVGGTSRITYGITNRLFFRKPRSTRSAAKHESSSRWGCSRRRTQMPKRASTIRRTRVP
jgi:hypothetical protein